MPKPSDEIPVVFRAHLDPPRDRVDLRGDLIHWSHVEPMLDRGGAREATVRLGPGTYEYKLHADGDAWLLDPHNPRTRSRDGIRNSLLVVGGADEPVLHAPSRPWLYREPDGRVCLRAGLRRSAGDALAVRWDEGDGPREALLQPIDRAGEDEHALFEAHLPASARAIDYVFVLPGGRVVGGAGGAGQAIRAPLAALEREMPPWWPDAIIYSIFVDRFRRGGAGGAWIEPRKTDKDRAGGDLDGVTEALAYLADLGVNAIHLTPIALAPSAHRYDAIDPRAVDPALGGEAALGRLLGEADRRGIKVLLDVVVTHVHMDFFAFRDVRERGPISPYYTWFYMRYWPFPEGPDGGYLHYQKGAWREPLLRVEDAEVEEYLAGTFEHWARFGANGFRIDAAADVPLALLRRIGQKVRAVSPAIALYAEHIPPNIHRVTSDAIHAATDFPRQEALFDLVLRRPSASIEGPASASIERVATELTRRRVARGGPGACAIAFTATHDQPRLRTLVRDARAARIGALVALLSAPIPALYYGDEVGLEGTGELNRDFDDAWPDRSPMPWDERAWDHETRALVRDAIAIRRDHDALRRGDESFAPLAEDVLLIRRSYAGSIVDVILHAGEGERTVAMPADAPSSGRLLLGAGGASLRDGAVTLGPWAAAVIAREPSNEAQATLRTITAEGPRLAALAFREGLVECPALPSRLYLTVTERCNIRCAHCITDAPARTASGRAREASPWLLDALEDAFAAASYVAFVHGGESLVASIFPEALRRVQRARASAKGATHVHVLSNGVLLNFDRARRLIDLGVTSLSVSLDGATAATNDKIRVGGRFHAIVENLRDVARAREGSDLRAGISTVITASNVGELAALGRLVIDLGFDWLKVEEMFPCTPVARRELVFPRDERVERAMNELRAALEGSRVTLVDHRDPPSGCACRADRDPALAAFRAADDYANRAAFQPCRMEWEQACVDPDGAVHPVDYAQSAIGNVMDRPLLALWNGDAMRAARAAALARTPAATRRACAR